MISQANISSNTPMGANLIEGGVPPFARGLHLLRMSMSMALSAARQELDRPVTYCLQRMRMDTGQVLLTPRGMVIRTISGSWDSDPAGTNAILTRGNSRRTRHSPIAAA